MALSSEEALQILDYEVMRGWLHAALVSKFSTIRRANEDFRMGGRSMLASYYGVSRTAGNEAAATRGQPHA
jgi:hypothetical protein